MIHRCISTTYQDVVDAAEDYNISEVLEIIMKLEASQVWETQVGMNQSQSQLANLMIQLQDIKKGRDIMGKYSAHDVMRRETIRINANIFEIISCRELQIR